MKYLLMISLAWLWAAPAASAQRINYYPDSIRIELPDQKTIAVIEMREYKAQPDFIQHFPEFLKEILGYVQKSTSANFADSGPKHIDVRLLPSGEKEILSVGNSPSYKPVGEKTLISIRPMEQPTTEVTVKEKEIVELLPPGWELVVRAKEFKASLYADSFQSLWAVAALDFTELASQISSKVPGSLGKSTIRSLSVFRNGKVEQSSFVRKYPGDNLFLTATAGAGLFRDKLYPQLSLLLGVTFRDRFGRQNIRTSLVSDNMIFAEKITEGYQTNVNAFLSLSFEKNFNHKTRQAQWIGIGAGLLVRKNGDYFTGNTAKLFIIHEMDNRRISLLPEFYLTNDFTKFAIGMTMRYTF